jgi:hypothetical protein
MATLMVVGIVTINDPQKEEIIDSPVNMLGAQ